MYEKLIPANAHEHKKQEQRIIYNHVQNFYLNLWQVSTDDAWRNMRNMKYV